MGMRHKQLHGRLMSVARGTVERGCPTCVSTSLDVRSGDAVMKCVPSTLICA